MPHATPLIALISLGVVLAFIAGYIAQHLRLSPLVGYLLAGMLIGPFTPGFIADQGLANQLAEIGVILLYCRSNSARLPASLECWMVTDTQLCIWLGFIGVQYSGVITQP